MPCQSERGYTSVLQIFRAFYSTHEATIRNNVYTLLYYGELRDRVCGWIGGCHDFSRSIIPLREFLTNDLNDAWRFLRDKS